MNTKRILALLVAALMLGSACPVFADGPILIAPRPGILISPAPVPAGGSFSDIYNTETARNAEILRLLEVIDGVGGGRFDPSGSLTRAQFTKMVIALLGETREVGRYAGYTIFPDVRGSHWAAGYINYALRGCSVRFISGYPDGSFGPEDPITLGQAVTILMRLMGYTDDQVGLAWPDGYLATAASIGLTDGLEALDGFDPITRAQAAKLFVQLLRTPVQGGSSYAATLFTVRTGLVVLNTDATAQDGTPGALETTEGVRKVKNGPAASLFTGLRGDLLLDGSGLVRSFLPETGTTSRTISLASARADKLTDGEGRSWPVDPETPLYLRGEATTCGAGWTGLTPGTLVTVYYNAAGRAEYIFAGAASSAAALVQVDGSDKELRELTGGARYTLYKNGSAVVADALRRFDVLTYDPVTASATACDARLSGCLETVAPSWQTPASVTVLGQQFDLLPAAASDLAGFRQGDPLVLLLTAEGKVAGIQAPGTLQSNLWGILESCSADRATVTLCNGMTVSGDPELSTRDADKLAGSLVYLSSDRMGKLELTPLSTRIKGELDPAARKLGDNTLTPTVRVFEQVTDLGLSSALREISLADLPQGKLPADRVLCAGYDYAGQVEVLVVRDVTGDLYEYGLLTYRQGDMSGGEMGYFSSGSLTVENGSTVSGNYNLMTRSGVYGGLVLSARGDAVVKSVYLTGLAGVPASAFGRSAVTVGGTVYPLADGLKCWNETLETWVSREDALAFSDQFDLWYDKDPAQGGKIRVLVVR